MSSAVRQLRRQQARTQLAARPKRVDEDENREERRRYQIPLSRRFESASKTSRSPQTRRLAETMEMPCAFCEFPMKYHPQPELYPCPIGVTDGKGVFLSREAEAPTGYVLGGAEQADTPEPALAESDVPQANTAGHDGPHGHGEERSVQVPVEAVVVEGDAIAGHQDDGAENVAVLKVEALDKGVLTGELGEPDSLAADGGQPDNSTPAWDGKLNWRPRVAIFVEPTPKKHQKRGRMAQRKALS